MARRRFYAPLDNITDSLVTLSTDETHHLIRVLRMTPGDEVFVFDGCGQEYRCSFRRVDADRAQLEIADALSNVVESPLHLTLAQALAKGEKFDFIIQKATELGVSSIVPLATRYADVRLDEQQKSSRVDRWRRISLEALKQCGRRRLVEIESPQTLQEFIAERARLTASPAENVSGVEHALLLFSEHGGAPVSEALAGLSSNCSVSVLIGPEGGWSPDELGELKDCGCHTITLGSRILRTETAALVAITLIQHAIGDLSR